MSSPDEARLLRLIDGVYCAAMDPTAWQTVAEDIADFCSGRAFLFSQDITGPSANIAAAGRYDPSFLDSYERHYSRHRPWQAKLGTIKSTQVVTHGWFAEAVDYERSVFYNEWLKPQDIYFLLGAGLHRRGKVSTFLAIGRSARVGNYEKRELRIIRAMLPHLRRAIDMHLHLFAANLERGALTRSLEGLRVGVMLVGIDGEVSFTNRIADDILRRGDGLTARRMHLEAATPALTRALRRLVFEAASTGAGLGRSDGGALVLPRRLGANLCVLVCPFPMDASRGLGEVRPTALLFVTEPDRPAGLHARDLMRCYGFTVAEARLAGAIVAGQSLTEFAEAADITLATAKTHLQHIFDKTDCRRQSDLIREILTNPLLQISMSN